MDIGKTKVCTRCKRELTLDSFGDYALHKTTPILGNPAGFVKCIIAKKNRAS